MTAPAETIEITEVTGIRDVDRVAWDLLAGGASLYSCHRWLEYVEQYRDCDRQYLLAHVGDELVGALPCSVFPAEVPRYYDPAFLFRVAGAPEVRPLVLGGTRQGYATEFLLAPDLPRDVATSVVGGFVDKLRSVRDSTAGMGAMLYLTDAAVELVVPSLADRDRVLLLDSRARLGVDRSGLDGYRATVSTNTANRMRKEMRRFREAGCRVEVRRLSDCHRELGGLSAPVLQRYGHPITVEEETTRFAIQAEMLDDLCHVLLARLHGRIVGFTQFLVWNGVMYGRVHGVDDTVARDASLYFNLTYYHAIEFAAAQGYTMIDLGCDSYEAKVRRGARLEPLWGLVLDAPWSSSGAEALRAEQEQRLAEFAAWDEHILTPTAARTLGHRSAPERH